MDKIEIFDEESSMFIDTTFHHTSLEFFPDVKKYDSTMNMKEDVYYRNETYEYKISANPIKVFNRLLERSDEPPLRHAVKDGVVLEAEITKDKTYSPSLITRLKEEIEWTELKYYPILFYILSKHSEIISKEDYRKFLRQTEQKIKLALSKIENRIKEKDTTGLKILDSEYGKQIWYSDIPENISKEDREEMDRHAAQDFYKPLFDEKSSDYCGIPQYEFEASSEILEHIDKLLNTKPAPPVAQDHKTTAGKHNSMKWVTVIILSIIALSWGIWTAIGVFILGSIIINIFKT